MWSLTAVAKAILPAFAQRWLRDRWGRLCYDPNGRISRFLDRRAARRLLRAIIVRTDDVKTVRWLGKPVWQYPVDAWVLQEYVSEMRPDLIIETGTWEGGSAYFLACLCDLLRHGHVISVDIAPRETIAHPRITYVTGSSVDASVVARVVEERRRLDAHRVLVILDSDHTHDHVFRELESYTPMIQPGGHVHVQDGCIDELEIFRGHRPGPASAVRKFLKTHPKFVRDPAWEARYVLTAHPFGWLRRVDDT